MASYVIIWENNTLGHQKVPGRIWPGHAAMNIGEEFDKDNNNYVSWWPDGTANFNALHALFSKAQGGHRHSTFTRDVRSEKYLPDHVIRLNSGTGRENRMRAEWQAVYMKDGGSSYKNLRKNCSTIVARVLHAGGYHARKWAVDSNWVWTPSDVAKLARGAGGDHLSWTEFKEVLQASGVDGDNIQSHGEKIKKARSGVYCSTGARVWYQKDARRPQY
jgi:hypothetical protein